VTDEDEYFPLPAALRRLIPGGALGADRRADAGAALERLERRVGASPSDSGVVIDLRDQADEKRLTYSPKGELIGG